MIVRIRLADQNTTLVIIHSHLAIAPVISRDPVHVDPLSAVHYSQAAVTLGPITNPFILGAAQTLLPSFLGLFWSMRDMRASKGICGTIPPVHLPRNASSDDDAD